MSDINQATTAKQDTGNASLASIDAKQATLGQKNMAGSEPVVIASDQSAIPVSQSGTWNINNISGTVALPTGAATAANQTTEITSLQLIDDAVYTNATGTPSKGYAVMGSDGTNPRFVSTTTAGAVNIADGGNSITVDGSVTVTQATGTNLHTVVDSGTITTITNVVHVDDNAGSLTVDGTVAATQSGTWNITNVSGTVSLPTGAATEATLTKLPILPGTSLGSNSGVLAEGSVTTSAPTYTTGNINPLSLTTAGALRTDSSASTQPVSGTVTVTQATGTNLHAVIDSGTITTVTNVVHVDDNAGSLTVDGTVAATQSGTWTVQQGTPPWSVTGNVASGATDSGNPVKVGGIFNTALPTITNGQRGDIQLDSSARQIIAPLTNTSIVKSQLQDNSGTAITLGQKVMASSVPVVLASDQSNIITQLSANSSSTDINALSITGTVTDTTTSTFTTGNYASASFFISFTCTNTGGHTLTYFDLTLQESWDGGTNFQDVYWFPRMYTGASAQIFTTPPMRLSGTSYRFKYTKTGFSPNAATLTIKTLKFSHPAKLIRSIRTSTLDSTINGSYTTPLYVEGCTKHTMSVGDSSGDGLDTTVSFWISDDNLIFYDTGYSFIVNSDLGSQSFSTPVPVCAKWGAWAVTVSSGGGAFNVVYYSAEE